MDLFDTAELLWFASAAVRLVVALILGGLVGYEREHSHRPAGFRTHILVSVGAALVMLTGEFVARAQGANSTIDPTRLGAQVVSGIGFLGAGTIIRNGSSVKGLTTAASLWAVACIGLAAGSGFYPGAILAALLTFVVLIALKILDRRVAQKRGHTTLEIRMSAYGIDVSHILRLAREQGHKVRRIHLISPEELEETTGDVVLQIQMEKLDPEKTDELVRAVYGLDTVTGVFDV